MLSGIGPAETLSQHNIPLISDLAGVGQNMIVRFGELLYRRLHMADYFSGPSLHL
jgi:hypothetical protein